MHPIVPLDTLGESERARVLELVGPDAWRVRLEEIGLRAGATVRLIKRGSPCLMAVGEQRISLRIDAGTMVLVQLIEDDGPVTTDDLP